MSINLAMDFSVNKQNNTISVKREFNAMLPVVWDAFTKSEILDQWWAPIPYKNETISMDFTEGGKWHYAMVSPKGERHYCMLFYLKINNQVNYESKDSFCDENGVLTDGVPSMNWNTRFIDNNGSTSVNILISFSSESDLQQIIEMGFKEGFTMGLNQLDNLLKN